MLQNFTIPENQRKKVFNDDVENQSRNYFKISFTTLRFIILIILQKKIILSALLKNQGNCDHAQNCKITMSTKKDEFSFTFLILPFSRPFSRVPFSSANICVKAVIRVDYLLSFLLFHNFEQNEDPWRLKGD